jgi:hypothetical protein
MGWLVGTRSSGVPGCRWQPINFGRPGRPTAPTRGPTIIRPETYGKPFECPLRRRSESASFL